MERQLLFFDIDGTLLSEITHTVPESTKIALQKAHDNGHYLFINTGRTIGTLPKFIHTLPFDGFVCGCGTQIVLHQKTIYKHHFSSAEKEFIYNLLEHYQLEVFLEGEEGVCCQRKPYRQTVMNTIKAFFTEDQLCHDTCIEDRTFNFDKFILMSDDTPSVEEFIKETSSILHCIDRGNHMYECIPSDCSKGIAIKKLAEYLSSSIKNTYAFGDSSNDLTMFEIAGHGIAMGSHSEVLEPFSEYITATVENDGIKQAMKHFGII